MKNKISIYIIFVLLTFQAISFTSKAEDKTYESEQIHLHVQKNVFLAGESVLFKLYCFNSVTHKLSDLSKVAYLELIDENGNAVAQDQIILQNGMGNGGFEITGQLSTGNYAINAYTHWMNSTSKELTSVTPIFVFNNQNLTNTSTDSKQIAKPIQFFDLKDNNRTILRSDSIANPETPLTIESTLEDLDRYLKFTVSASDNSLNKTEQFQFQIFSKNGNIIDESFQLSDNKWEFKIHKNKLDLPNYGICIKNSNDQIITQSLIHLSENIKGLFFENPRISANSNEKIKLNFNINDFSNEANSVFLSASIKLKEPFKSSANIIDYLNTNADLGASKNGYFQQLSTLTNQDWIVKNNLQSLWTNAKSKQSITSTQYPEEEAYVVEGQIRNQKTKKALFNTSVYLSKIGEYADVSTFKTQEDGRFFFHLPLKKGLHDISIQIKEEDSKEACSIELIEKYNQIGYAPATWKKNSLNKVQLDFIKNLYENYRVRNIYKNETYTEVQDTNLYRGESNFFGKPYSSIKIENYIKLDSLEEYFHEFVAPVKISYRKKKSYMNVYSPEQLTVMDEAPLILFDGLIISDPRIILNKQPSEIDRIDVMPYEYYYGKSHFYGIIHTISKNKDCKIDQLPMNTERYYLPLFTSSYSLNQPLEINEKFNPDFRSDLYWEPNITLTKDQSFELEFKTSDIKGEYELTIEGISDTGIPMVLKQSIFIK